jgi:mannose/fructose/N-acetylgalactosamine-specific phosphotransferase system component IIC
MFLKAFLVAFAYYITWFIDGTLGWQTATRPIVLGTVTGLLCGDITTGIIMGASLEAVYMGISGIGGVVAADYRSGTAIGVGLTILSGIAIDEGIAIAVPIGALCVSLMPVTTAFANIMEGPLMKAAKEGNVKKYNRLMWFQAIVVQHLIDTLVIFLCCYFGSEAVSVAFDVIPAWLLTGLTAAGNMLVVVGLCLTTQAIFSKYTIPFVLLGFVLSKYLGMPVMAIAIVGFICAFMLFDRKNSNQNVTTAEGGDDFYA